MSAARPDGLRMRLIGWALVLALAGLPLTWIPLASLGGFDLTLPYALSIALGGVLLLHLRRALLSASALIPAVTLWLVPYLVYLFVLKLHLAGLPDNGIILRQLFFLTCAGTIATALLLCGGEARLLRRGGFAALAGFVLIAEIHARQLGMSWLDAVTRFLSGDLNFVIYKFLRAIFQSASGDQGEVPASLKNAVSGGLLIGLILYRAGHESAARDGWGRIVTLITLVILLLLNTRSVLLIAALILPGASIIATLRRPRHSANRLILKLMLGALALSLGAMMLLNGSAATDLIESRFTFEDASTGGRFAQFSFALSGIERHVFAGSGLHEINGLLVHNLFLGAWLHGGLLAFLLVLLTYGAMLGLWGHFVARIATQRGYWLLPVRAEWVAMLPVLAFFRVWIAGDAGHPGYPEWISITGFFAMVLANAQARRPVARRESYPIAQEAFA
ncbi:hypothetical protein [Thioclava pacifica]|uniref:O-antigen ligase domain-containing protein n=1 Tax=Thioclava pacifica DSM 10166 TaxID=1353537 RepID=A0A074J2X7_9RHOB|nr:hypothetical protein [Thioclava pacifica]KEO50869.1 hypothetical protein TP2_13355 [Thioclava pacifica DSM 10166]